MMSDHAAIMNIFHQCVHRFFVEAGLLATTTDAIYQCRTTNSEKRMIRTPLVSATSYSAQSKLGQCNCGVGASPVA